MAGAQAPRFSEGLGKHTPQLSESVHRQHGEAETSIHIYVAALLKIKGKENQSPGRRAQSSCQRIHLAKVFLVSLWWKKNSACTFARSSS